MTGFGFVLGQRRAPGTRGGGCWRTTDLLRLVLASPAFLLESPTLDPRFSLSSSAAHLLLSVFLVFSSFKPSLSLDSSPSCNLCSALFLLRSLPPKPVSLFQTSCLSLQSLHLPFSLWQSLPLSVCVSVCLMISLSLCLV